MKKIINKQPVVFKLKSGMTVNLLYEDCYNTYIELDVVFGALDVVIRDKNNQIIKFPYGSAHFLEHVMFAMPDNEDGLSVLTNMGLNANAVTSMNRTAYMISGHQKINEGLLYLLKMIDTPYITNDLVEKERRIIKEELNMELDNLDFYLKNEMLNNLFKNHPIKEEILGSHESLNEITADHLETAYEYFYQPSNRVLTILGPIDVDQIVDLLNKYSETLLWSENQFERHYNYKERKEVVVREKTTLKDYTVGKSMLGIKIKETDTSKSQQLINYTIYSCLTNLLFGPSTNIYQHLTTNKLINDEFYGQVFVTSDYSVILVDNSSDSPEILSKEIESYILNDPLKDLTENDLELIKRSLVGSFIMALDDFENKAFAYAQHKLYQFELDDVITTILNITTKQIKEVFQKITRDSISLLTVIPLELE